MENKLIRCYKLNKWNIITVSSYVVLSIFLLTYSIENKYDHRGLLFFYGFGTQFFIYGFQYRALRNFNYFLIWVLIAIIHFYIFLVLKNFPELELVESHAAAGLRSTIFSLLLFQFLRFISLKIQHKELVVPAKNSRYDILDERKVTIVDGICFLVFIAATVFFITLR